MAATTEEVPRPYGLGTSSVVSFVVAMNRVDVVELVVDLDVDLVDVDLAVSLCDGLLSVLFSFGLVAPTSVLFTFGPTSVLFTFGPDFSFILLQFFQLPGMHVRQT